MTFWLTQSESEDSDTGLFDDEEPSDQEAAAQV